MDETKIKEETITVFVLEFSDDDIGCVYHDTLQDAQETLASFYGDDWAAAEGTEVKITVERVTREFYEGLGESDFF